MERSYICEYYEGCEHKSDLCYNYSKIYTEIFGYTTSCVKVNKEVKLVEKKFDITDILFEAIPGLGEV